MRGLQADPLTWTYVKLLGCQLQENVRDWDGLPNSHAWASSQSASPQHLLTKAQCVGILVSIHQRAERVELLVDDGTALVRAVQWKPSLDENITLGDLVRVEGKLNMDTSWAADTAMARELRVISITKIDDSNEELLHWLDVAELTCQVYNTDVHGSHISSQEGPASARQKAPPATTASSVWDQIVLQAFHDSSMDETLAKDFLARSDKPDRDAVLVTTLQQLLDQQTLIISASDADHPPPALRVQFPELLHKTLAKEGIATENALHHSLTRSLRHAFATLRSSGLLYLENTECDQYMLLSADIVLAPALTDFLRLKPAGLSTAEIADWTLSQAPFRRLPLESLERTLQALTGKRIIEFQEDSLRWFYRSN